MEASEAGEQLRSPGAVFLSFTCSKGGSSAIFKPVLQGETAHTMATVTECFCRKQYPRTARGRKGRAHMDPSLCGSLREPFKSFRDCGPTVQTRILRLRVVELFIQCHSAGEHWIQILPQPVPKSAGPKTFSNYTSDRGLVSIIYKELYKTRHQENK